jgi:hypothetical protein
LTKTVTFVTSGQPAANPRLIKEVTTLFELGFKINVLYTPISLWADKFDEIIFKTYPTINWIKCGVSRKDSLILYLYFKVRRKTWQFIYWIFGDLNDAAIKSFVLYSQDLLKQSLKLQSDLYIGHNLGSLLAITKAARKYGVSHIFDFEDFHRGEYLANDIEKRKVVLIELKYINQTLFVSASSPLIMKKYQELFPRLNFTS